MLETKQKRIRRHKRIRAKISGTKTRPRLCVFFSNNHVYAQLINDEAAAVLASASDSQFKKPASKTKAGKVKLARQVGLIIAKIALEKKIEKVVFDRGGFKYHGVAKSLAEGAREGGLKF